MKHDMTHTITNNLKALLVATLTMLMSSNAFAQGVVVNGNVYGGGNLTHKVSDTL